MLRKSVNGFLLVLIIGIAMLPQLVGAQSASSASVYLDGNPLAFEHEIVEVNGYTYVPFRNLFEALNVTIGWNASTKTITGQADSNTLELQIGSLTALVDGKSVILDAAPFVRNGTSYVPLRFASQSLGLLVQWYPAERAIRLSKNYVTLNIKNALGDKVTNEEVSVQVVAKERQQEPYSLDHRQATVEITGLLPEREYEVSVQIKDTYRYVQPKPFVFVYKAGTNVLPDLLLEDAPSDQLRGTVTDSDGNPVPNVSLTLHDMDTQGDESIPVIPDEKGLYSLPRLIAGHKYFIFVKLKGIEERTILLGHLANVPKYAVPGYSEFTYKPGMKSFPSIVVPKVQWTGNIALQDGAISAIVSLFDEKTGKEICYSYYYSGQYALGGMVEGRKYRITIYPVYYSNPGMQSKPLIWEHYYFTYDPAVPAPNFPVMANK